MPTRDYQIAQLKQLVQMIEENENIQFVIAIVDHENDFDDHAFDCDATGAYDAMAVLENALTEEFPELCDCEDEDPTTDADPSTLN